MSKTVASDSHIKVVCRFRPLNELEKSKGGEACVELRDNKITVKVQGESAGHEFSFDSVYGPDSRQKDIFNEVGAPVINSVLNGFNGTILAYGQTSSGKTHTMEGPTILKSDDDKGIIPRMIDYIFEYIYNNTENIEFIIKLSFLEIYNEKIHDLFDTRKNNLHIKEDRQRGIFVQDATEIYVNDPEQMRKSIKAGSENRTIAATKMNERSSRSHSLFILTVTQKNLKTETVKHSKLYLTDLAGSEKIAKTHVTGQQLEEAKNINKSLSALGNVINALTSDKKEHVPYRDSKLTRILQESLGGNSKTSLVINCSICSYNDKETLSTLRFGQRAKSIKNTPVQNVEMSAKELRNLLELAEKRIQQQEALIEALQNGDKLSTIVSRDKCLSDFDVKDAGNNPFFAREPRSHEHKSQKDNQDGPVLSSASPANDLVHERSKSVLESSKSKGPNLTLTILRQHIALVNIQEDMKRIELEKAELIQELDIKNAEIYELNEKLLNKEKYVHSMFERKISEEKSTRQQFNKLKGVNNKRLQSVNYLRNQIQIMRAEFMVYQKSSLNNEQRPSFIQKSRSFMTEEIQDRLKNFLELLEKTEKELTEEIESPKSETEIQHRRSDGAITEARREKQHSNSPVSKLTKIVPAGPTIKHRNSALLNRTEIYENLSTDCCEEGVNNWDQTSTSLQEFFDLKQKTEKISEKHDPETKSIINNQAKMIDELMNTNRELIDRINNLCHHWEKNIELEKQKTLETKGSKPSKNDIIKAFSLETNTSKKHGFQRGRPPPLELDDSPELNKKNEEEIIKDDIYLKQNSDYMLKNLSKIASAKKISLSKSILAKKSSTTKNSSSKIITPIRAGTYFKHHEPLKDINIESAEQELTINTNLDKIFSDGSSSSEGSGDEQVTQGFFFRNESGDSVV